MKKMGITELFVIIILVVFLIPSHDIRQLSFHLGKMIAKQQRAWQSLQQKINAEIQLAENEQKALAAEKKVNPSAPIDKIDKDI